MAVATWSSTGWLDFSTESYGKRYWSTAYRGRKLIQAGKCPTRLEKEPTVTGCDCSGRSQSVFGQLHRVAGDSRDAQT